MYKTICILSILALLSIGCDEISDNELGGRIEAINAINAGSGTITGTVDINDDGEGDLPLIGGCLEPFIDEDGDGDDDFLDLDCNGVNDLQLGISRCDSVLSDKDSNDIPEKTKRDCDGDIAVNSTKCIPRVIDSDDNGTLDGIDTDCNMVVDFSVENLMCTDLVDENSDGTYDGIDLDCKRTVDILLKSNGPCLIDADGDGTYEGIDVDCDGDIDQPCGCQPFELTACLDDGYRGCRRGGRSNWITYKRGHAHHRPSDGMCGSNGYYSIRWGGAIDVLMTVPKSGEYSLSFVHRGSPHQDDEALRVEVNDHQRFDFEDDDDIDDTGQWVESQPITVTLKSGINFITLRSIGRHSVHLEQVILRDAGSCDG
jgi:hypothetical protein